VYRTKGDIEWIQAEPNTLLHSPLGAPRQSVTRGSAAAGPAAGRVTRIPPGHPEGYLEGFANLYTDAATAIRAVDADQPIPGEVDFPGISDGVIGMAFVKRPCSRRPLVQPGFGRTSFERMRSR
jgi:hypothetical protein